jgi:hypothetical protein
MELILFSRSEVWRQAMIENRSRNLSTDQTVIWMKQQFYSTDTGEKKKLNAFK